MLLLCPTEAPRGTWAHGGWGCDTRIRYPSSPMTRRCRSAVTRTCEAPPWGQLWTGRWCSLAHHSKEDGVALSYWRAHERLWAVAQDGWMNFAEEDEHKSALLGNAVGLLFPIHWPGPFGLVMIEAMSCGTPVIAWRCVRTHAGSAYQRTGNHLRS
jgi:glycosyltransferase involved in cell wall biosynthesis